MAPGVRAALEQLTMACAFQHADVDEGELSVTMDYEQMKRLNLGCGLQIIPGFENIDGSPNVWLSRVPVIKSALFKAGLLTPAHMAVFPREILWMRLPRGLRRYSDGCADRVYSSHFIEHLPEHAAMKTFQEIYRILGRGGIFRLVLPDTAIYARRYLEQVDALTSAGHATVKPRESLAMHVAGALYGRRPGHYLPWDIPSAEAALRTVGFVSITRTRFRVGEDPVMAAADNRPDDSLFLECIRDQGGPSA